MNSRCGCRELSGKNGLHLPLPGDKFLSCDALSLPMIHDGLRFLLAGSRVEADRIQEELRTVPARELPVASHEIRSVAGLDAAYSGDYAAGAAVVLTYPGLREICHATATREAAFPYIPGYLAFREGPVLYEAFRALECAPDLLLFHGHGIAHPKKLGLATHLGLLLGIPSIGVAKRPLSGFSYDIPDILGGITPLMSGNEVVGSVIRGRKGGSLLFVSPGYGVDVARAASLVMATLAGHALPEPLWIADRISREFLKRYPGFHAKMNLKPEPDPDPSSGER
jgi:deoxyribonuclease V